MTRTAHAAPLALCFALALALAACGGAAAEAPAPTPEPAAAPAPPPPPVVERRQPNPHEGLIWYVYWEGIHCLTVYPQPGLIRSEEPDSANATFRGRSEHFSIISVYWEREDAWADAIEAATGVDDLLRRLRAMEMVEVEEAVNPVQGSSF